MFLEMSDPKPLGYKALECTRCKEGFDIKGICGGQSLTLCPECETERDSGSDFFSGRYKQV